MNILEMFGAVMFPRDGCHVEGHVIMENSRPMMGMEPQEIKVG
jgi:hypothetical protein